MDFSLGLDIMLIIISTTVCKYLQFYSIYLCTVYK